MQPPGDGLPVGSYDQRDTESHGKQPKRDDRPAAPGRAGSAFMIADRIGGGGVDQRLEEGRVGKDGVRKCQSWWSQYHLTEQQIIMTQSQGDVLETIIICKL